MVNAALPHEHFFSDLRTLVAPIDNGISYDKVQLNNYGALSRNPYAVLDNAVLDSESSVEDELNRIKKQGLIWWLMSQRQTSEELQKTY